MKKDFSFLSADGRTRSHGIIWIPEGEVRAILQICHGMVEYIDRYDEFARYLNGHGYLVIGHDHLGHGKTAAKPEDYGHFPEEYGNDYVIGDIHRVRRVGEKNYPDLPYFMLGHSMGSFLLRQYLTMYADGLAGAIIMGTGEHSMAELNMGQKLCKGLAAVRGWHYHSPLVHKMSVGNYNRKFHPAVTATDWISSDLDVRRKYEKDPLCSFQFTVGGYYQMFEGMKVLARKESIEKISKDLPIFFVSGADDPVGDFGKAVQKVYDKYKNAGFEKVEMKLYQDDRHEILNETDRSQVFEDLYLWMEENLSL